LSRITLREDKKIVCELRVSAFYGMELRHPLLIQSPRQRGRFKRWISPSHTEESDWLGLVPADVMSDRHPATGGTFSKPDVRAAAKLSSMWVLPAQEPEAPTFGTP
jgi:hypothetical protein